MNDLFSKQSRTWTCSNSCLARSKQAKRLLKNRSNGSSFEAIRDMMRKCKLCDSSKISLHSFMRNVGHGSSRQDFVGELLPAILFTVSSETSLTAVIFGRS